MTTLDKSYCVPRTDEECRLIGAPVNAEGCKVCQRTHDKALVHYLDLIELQSEYIDIINARVAAAKEQPRGDLDLPHKQLTLF